MYILSLPDIEHHMLKTLVLIQNPTEHNEF